MKWKSYAGTIEMTNMQDNFPGIGSIVSFMEKKKAEIEECLVHKLDNNWREGSIRRYRRGKNRCKRCGSKK